MIVGGMGSSLGAVLGTLLIVLLPEAVRGVIFGYLGGGHSRRCSPPACTR